METKMKVEISQKEANALIEYLEKMDRENDGTPSLVQAFAERLYMDVKVAEFNR